MLEPGKFADLAVLSSDYMSDQVKEIGSIRSLLTMVGGKVVHAAAPFGTLMPTARSSKACHTWTLISEKKA